MPERKKSKKSLPRRAIDEPRISIDDMAEAVGQTRSSLEKYREEKRAMPKAVKRKLATFLEKHARRLLRIADELKRD